MNGQKQMITMTQDEAKLETEVELASQMQERNVFSFSIKHCPIFINQKSGGNMKIRLFLILIFTLIVMTACMNPKEMEEAWDACHAATGTQSGRKVAGIVYGVGTFNQGELGSAKDLYSNKTNDLSKASAVLCEEVFSSIKETCSYESGFVLRYHNTEAHLTLISWPLKEIIAQTSISGGFGEYEVFCPPTYTHVGDEKVHDEYATIFINDWLNQFVTAPEESE